MSKSRREHMERELERVEVDRSQPLTEEDVARLLADMRSPAEGVRLRALRASCPCHVPWEVFERLRKPAQRLRKDPSPAVRRLARHLEEDAREIAIFEADLRRIAIREDDMADYASRSRQRTKRRHTRDGH